MTTLSEAINAIEPKIQGTAPIGDGRTAVDFVGAEDYERVKQVAAILARACEEIKEDRVVYLNGEVDKNLLTWTAWQALDSLTFAKKLMEEK